jgi:hypothetical protein
MATVFARSSSEGAARLVLLALADVAADTGEVTAYKRSHSILAQKANCADGTVRRAIAKLVELGEVKVLDAGGGRKSASYQITLVGPAPDDVPAPEPAPDEGGPDDGAGGAIRAGTPRETRGHPAPDEHPVSPSLFVGDPSSSTTSSADEQRAAAAAGFDAFWSVYPRHVAKAQAALAWGKALKAATAVVILAGAERYAAETKGRAVDKIAHPTTWLNGRRWEDEPGANASTTGRPPGGPPARGAAAPVTADRTAPAGRIQL